MSDIKFENENFLEAVFGNFLDCIQNNVYGLQTYIDIFHDNVSSIYLTIENVEDKNIKEILKFVVMETDNILKSKIISFAMDTDNLVTKKYEALLEQIKTDKEKHMYLISLDAYRYLDDFQNDIQSHLINTNPYFKKPGGAQSYNFLEYMNYEFDTYKKLKFEKCGIPLSKDDLITVLDGAFTKVSVAMLQLQKQVENSDSMYSSSIICKKIITILIVIYEIVSTIEFYKD